MNFKTKKLPRSIISFTLAIAMVLTMFTGNIGLMGKAADATVNLALGKQATSSGQEVAGKWGPDKVVTGRIGGIRWSSNTADNAWIVVNLGEPMEIGKVVLNWELKAMRFKLQASDDGQNWTDIDTRYVNEDNAGTAKLVNTIELDTPVVTQYVKMQGIKRTAADSGDYYGYSLYEFEIYAPDVRRPDAEVAQEVLDSIVVPGSAVKDFTLPVKGEQKTTIAWTSTHEDIIAVDAAGNAKVTLPAEETVVTLKATVTTGEVVLTKDFDVTVKSSADAPVDYEIYPQVQKITYGAENFAYTNEVNVVKEAGVSEEAVAYLEKVLASHGMTAVYADELSAEKTNILLGIKGAAGAADSYFEGISYDAAALTDHTDGYILDVAAKNAGTFAVLGQDASAVFFSLTTLDQMLGAEGTKASEVTIEDYADMKTRGFIEGYYGVPWSYEERAEQMRYGATQKMNTYIYAPKDDPYHRAQWATLYPEEDQAKIRMLCEVAKENNYDFIWTLHP
ncbi:MAG: beta-N-acetylglucosaminidase domain-containing protein, partial [Oscillospiraceae bacterium]